MRQHIDSPLRGLREISNFIENVSTKIHSIPDEHQIYRIIEEESLQSGYILWVFLLTDESKLKIAEVSIPPQKLEAAEKATGLQLLSYTIDLDKSPIFFQVVREGETVLVTVQDVMTELIPQRTSALSEIVDMTGKSVLTPLKRNGKIAGAIALASPELTEHFIPLVRILAQNISTALESSCNPFTVGDTEPHPPEELERIAWLVKASVKPEPVQSLYEQSYGNLAELNTCRLLLDSVGEDVLSDIVGNYLNHLETSAAIYEKNGDYALGIFSSGWCRFLDAASRSLCNTDDNREALRSGKWHCHESCWTEASQTSIETGQPVDIECQGGIHIYAAPIRVNGEIVGSINVGYGDPPKDPEKLEKIAERYNVSVKDLSEKAESYNSRPPFMIDLARNSLMTSAKLIGVLVEHNQAEKALQKQEEEFRLAFENAKDAIFWADLETGLIIRCNKAAELLLEKKREEIIGHCQTELHPPEESEYYAQMFRDHVRLKDSVGIEADVITASGKRKPVHITASVTVIDGTSVVQGIFRDMTELRRAEEKLKESEEMYRKLMETSPDSVIVTDIKGRITHVSQRTLQLHGVGTADELLGKRVLELIAPEDQKKARAHMEKALKEGSVQQVEYTFVRKDRSQFVGESNTTLVRDADGNPRAFIATVRDITDCKRAEETLQESEKKYRHLVESLSEGIWVIDENGYTTFANSRMAEMLKYTVEEMVGAHLFSFMDEQGTEICKHFLERRRQGIIEFHDFEFLRKDGTRIYTSLATSPIFEGGKYKGAIAGILDMSERKKMEREKEKILHDLGERVKELSCLYRIDETMRRKNATVKDVIKETVDLIPPTWQYSEVCGCCITFEDEKCETSNFKKTKWMQKADILVNNKKVGRVEVCYTDERPDADEGPFSREEQRLIFSIAERLGNFAERKKAEEEIRRAKEFSESIISNAEDGIVVTDLEGSFIQCNTAFLTMVGYTMDELKGVNFREITSEKWAKQDEEALKNLLRGVSVRNYEKEYIKKDGTIFPITISASLLTSKTGEPTGFIAIIKDITERKEMEEQLRESEFRYRTLFQSAPLAIGLTTKEGQILAYNDTMCQMTGYSRTELDTISVVNNYLNPEERPVVLGRLQKDGFLQDFEIQLKRKDGTPYWASLNILLFPLEGKDVFLTMIQDITFRKRTEEQIRTLSSAVEQSIDGIAIGNMESTLTYVNNAFAQMHGYSPEEMVCMNVAHLHNEEQMDEYKEKMDQVKTEGAWMGEIGHIRKDGTPFPTYVAFTLLKDERGNPAGILEVVRDITDYKKTEEQIRISLKEKEILLREIHHRVKNNLQVISSLLNLQSEHIEDEYYLEMLEDSQNRIKSMAFIHEALFQSENLARIDFNEYITRLVYELIRSYKAGDRIAVTIEVEDVSLDIDAAMPCGLIINELVSNALKHAFPDGRKGNINIVLHSIESAVELIVSDNGVGISEDIDVRTTGSLGLDLVTTLAEEQLNGELILDRGKGTTFRIRFER